MLQETETSGKLTGSAESFICLWQLELHGRRSNVLRKDGLRNLDHVALLSLLSRNKSWGRLHIVGDRHGVGRDLSWLDVGDRIQCHCWLVLRRVTSIKFGLLDMLLVIFLGAITAWGLMTLTVAIPLSAVSVP